VVPPQGPAASAVFLHLPGIPGAARAIQVEGDVYWHGWLFETLFRGGGFAIFTIAISSSSSSS